MLLGGINSVTRIEESSQHDFANAENDPWAMHDVWRKRDMIQRVPLEANLNQSPQSVNS